MNIVVKARHMEATDSIREYVQSKASKLLKFYDNITAIEVTLDLEADQCVVEILVQAKRKAKFVATHRDNDMYASLDQCLHKISEQVRRHKDKVRDHRAASHPHNQATEP